MLKELGIYVSGQSYLMPTPRNKKNDILNSNYIHKIYWIDKIYHLYFGR